MRFASNRKRVHPLGLESFRERGGPIRLQNWSSQCPEHSPGPVVDIHTIFNSITSRWGAFVYRSGHGPLKAERRVRFPYALPLKVNYFRKSAGKVQETQVALSAKD